MAGLVSLRSLMCWRSSARPLRAEDETASNPNDDGMAPRIGAGLAARLGLAALGAFLGAAATGAATFATRFRIGAARRLGALAAFRAAFVGALLPSRKPPVLLTLSSLAR